MRKLKQWNDMTKFTVLKDHSGSFCERPFLRNWDWSHCDWLGAIVIIWVRNDEGLNYDLIE